MLLVLPSLGPARSKRVAGAVLDLLDDHLLLRGEGAHADRDEDDDEDADHDDGDLDGREHRDVAGLDQRAKGRAVVAAAGELVCGRGAGG